MSEYGEFLRSKFRFSKAFGFEIDAGAIHPMLKPHQRDVVRWALHKGRAALFEAFGLGKTFQQIEIQRLIHAREGGRHLLIAPLGIRQEFKADTEKLGLGRDHYKFIRRTDEVDGDGFYLTNYESVRDGKLDVNLFTSVSLDEASVLRSYGSKTYQTFLSMFGAIKYKFAEDTKLRARMSELIREHGLSSTGLEEGLARSIGVARQVAKGERYEVVLNDCVEECRTMESDSVDLIHTSIPFGNHYEYSASYNDFGHNTDNERFFAQMDFLTPELLRILRPGRVAAIHVKDRIRFGNVTGTGFPTVEPFHADCIYHYRRHGFAYFGMVTVVTDVVRENNQTYRLGWTEQGKDGTKMGVGSPEYVLLFRKLQTDTTKGYADVPVVKSKEAYTRARWQIDAHAFWRSSGNRLLTVDEMLGYTPDQIGKVFASRSLETIYDYREHVRLGEVLDDRDGLPATFMAIAPGSHNPDVWHDINRMRTLNGDQVQRQLQQHVCPLQFDIVDRIIERYTNKGETVYDPFGGLFTVPYRAIKLGRQGKACELNAEYFRDGVRYLQAMEREVSAPTLFDFEALETAA